MDDNIFHMHNGMARTVEVCIGDWSDDGHGKFDTIYINISGEDVSDEALQASLEKSNEDFTIDVLDLFQGYEKREIPLPLFKKILAEGFKPAEGRDPDYYVWVEGEETDIDGLELLMWFIGRNIKDFGWVKIEFNYPTLVGGYRTILKSSKDWPSTSYGYGFFY